MAEGYRHSRPQETVGQWRGQTTRRSESVKPGPKGSQSAQRAGAGYQRADRKRGQAGTKWRQASDCRLTVLHADRTTGERERKA